jgi:16S rRNA (uracil1498-N3)-methyltransferase
VLTEVLPGLSPQEEILVAVGPEGGWTSEERELFRQSGWSSVSLGETILRAETAAIAATAIVVSALR